MTFRTLSTRAVLFCLGLLLMAAGQRAQAIPQFIAYHAATYSDQVTAGNTYPGQGYRMISLSVYGDPSDPRYAAVWVKRSGPAWVAGYKMSSSSYANFVSTYAGQGYRPISVSATGSYGSTVFAAIMEKSTVPGWFANHDLLSGSSSDSSTFEGKNKWAQDNGYMPLSLARYGSGPGTRYAGIWVYNTNNEGWNVGDKMDAAGYQNWFNAATKGGMRPKLASLSSDGFYLGCAYDEKIGPWYAYHNLTSADYQNAFNLRTSQGCYPIWVTAGGTGSGARFAALFATQETPITRVWSVKGSTPTGMSSANAAKFDKAMKDFLQLHNIRAGQLAFAENGKVLFNRAYTWAEPGYPATQPNTPMRLASVTKSFTCAAIQKLYDADPTLKYKKVFPLLGISQKALNWQTVDPRINDVTVQECVDHTGGWDTDISHFDPGFEVRKIAQDMGLSSPPTMTQIAQYMYGMPLQHDPGAENHYSNFGYMLLGLVVEKVTGTTFDDYVSNHVMAPAGLSASTSPGHTDKSLRAAGEGYYYDWGIGGSRLDPQSDTLEPSQWGGSFMMEDTVSAGGWLANAGAMVQFANTHAIWGLGGRAPNYGRTGGMPGTASYVVSRGDYADWAWIVNSRNWRAGHDGYGELAATVNGLISQLPPYVSSVTANPTTLVGGKTSAGTVNLAWPAPGAGVTVTLTSSDPAVASVPASKFITAGTSSIGFTIQSYPVVSTKTVTITATYNGQSQSVNVTVQQPALQSFTLGSASVTGGTNVPVQITLTGIVAADTVITLASTNPAAHVPSQITIPKGDIGASLWVTTDPVAVNTTGTISATLNGTTKSATLTVKYAVLKSITLNPSTVVGGKAVLGTVTMTGPVAVDTVINLTNTTPSASLPNGTNSDTVTILKGTTSQTFTMRTFPTTVDIKGTVKAAQGTIIAKSATLVITP